MVLLAELLALLTFFLFASSALAGRYSASGAAQDAHPSMVAQMPHIPTEPDSLRNSLSDAMKEALAQVEKVEALPSCFKIASSALLHSCSAMEGSMDHHDNIKRGSDLFVQEEADVYSARLAVCELSGADIIVPNECQAFIPRDSNSRKRTFGGLFGSRGSTKPRELFQFYDEITETNLKQCRKALGTSSQAWTSYSNNRQNAVVMCRAMRSEIEKDETIHVGKVLAGISTAAAESFEEVLRQSQDIKKQFQDLAAAMPKFQQDLVAHDKQRRDALGLFWTEVERAQASMRDLNAELNGAHEGATGITVALHEMVMDSIPELKEALLGASRHVDRVTDAAKAATEISSYAAEFIEHRIVQNAKAIGHDIDAVHAIIPGVHEQIALLVQNILSSQDLLLARQGQALSMQNQTMTNVEDITLMTERARVAIGPVTTALENLGSVIPGGLAAFSKWITTMTRLLISWAVFMLATFGFWERFSGFSKIGSLGLAVGTGLLPALFFSFVFDPIAHLADVSDLLRESDVLVGVAIGITGSLLLLALKHLLVTLLSCRRNQPKKQLQASLEIFEGPPYDPSSPPTFDLLQSLQKSVV